MVKFLIPLYCCGMNVIYFLRHPDISTARYIGVTKQPLRGRLRDHLKAARYGVGSALYDWIRQLLADGIVPVAEVIERTEDRRREIYWISHFRETVGDLLNSTSGGQGLRNPPARIRLAISAANKGRKLSPEHRLKLSASHRGIKPSARCIEIVRANKGWKHTPEALAKMRKPKSEAHRTAAAEAIRAKRASGQYRVLRGDENPMRSRPEIVRRGSQNGSAKLTEAAVIEMRALYAAGGQSTNALARRFGISQATCWKIVNGIAWRHVPMPQTVAEAALPLPLTAES